MTDEETLNHNLYLARHTAHGRSADLQTRDVAIRALLADADRAFPRLLADLEAGVEVEGTVAIIGMFDRPETVPPLAELLWEGAEPLRAPAAVALGQQTDPTARAALLAALDSPERATVLAALDGLRVTGDSRVCTDVAPRLMSDDAEVRWMALHTLTALSCLSAEKLREIAATDPDTEVRALAEKRARSLSGDR